MMNRVGAYLRSWWGCVEQIFVVDQVGKKARVKKQVVGIGLIDFKKAYD